MIKIIIFFFKDQATTHRKAQETLHRGTSTREPRRSIRKEPAQEPIGFGFWNPNPNPNSQSFSSHGTLWIKKNFAEQN